MIINNPRSCDQWKLFYWELKEIKIMITWLHYGGHTVGYKTLITEDLLDRYFQPWLLGAPLY